MHCVARRDVLLDGVHRRVDVLVSGMPYWTRRSARRTFCQVRHVVRWGASLSSEGAPSSEKRFCQDDAFGAIRAAAQFSRYVGLRSGADADDERLDVFFRMHTNSNLG